MEESEWERAREEERESKRRDVVWETDDWGRGTWRAENDDDATITTTQ